MIESPPPADEDCRIDALHALEVLDTEPEERFDRLVRLARRVFGVPMALVSLVDRQRQWHKARAGVEVCEIPRSLSFCSHALHVDGAFIVEDARLDPRFAGNPLVLGEPHVRFYAGHPLRASDGSKLGSFCVLDRQVRRFTDDDKSALRDLAGIAEAELTALHLATTDPLTGLANRRGFDQQARRMLASCRRLAMPAKLLYFDLDGFKAINDRHGHAVGDQVLVAFARLLAQSFRAADLCARLGGDEFVALLCPSGAGCEAPALSRLTRSVDDYNARSGLGMPLAFSVGQIDGGADVATLGQLLAEADRRMYLRKRTARGPTLTGGVGGCQPPCT